MEDPRTTDLNWRDPRPSQGEAKRRCECPSGPIPAPRPQPPHDHPLTRPTSPPDRHRAPASLTQGAQPRQTSSPPPPRAAARPPSPPLSPQQREPTQAADSDCPGQGRGLPRGPPPPDPGSPRRPASHPAQVRAPPREAGLSGVATAMLGCGWLGAASFSGPLPRGFLAFGDSTVSR
jgi:hypothetical protein